MYVSGMRAEQLFNQMEIFLKSNDKVQMTKPKNCQTIIETQRTCNYDNKNIDSCQQLTNRSLEFNSLPCVK